jgi:hypothetical protein
VAKERKPPRKRREPVRWQVVRVYEPDPKAVEQAVRALLKPGSPARDAERPECGDG